MINLRMLYKINILRINKHKEYWKNLLKNLKKINKDLLLFQELIYMSEHQQKDTI